MTGDLDGRVMAMADRIERAGKSDEADELRAHMAYLRETMRGVDMAGTLVEDLTTIADHAEGARRIVADHLDLPAE